MYVPVSSKRLNNKISFKYFTNSLFPYSIISTISTSLLSIKFQSISKQKIFNEETRQKLSTSKISSAQEEWMARKRQFVDWIPGAFSTRPRHGAIQLTQLTRDSRYVVLTRYVPRMSIFVNGQTAIGVQWLRARVSHTCAAIITRSRAIWRKRSSLTNDGHDSANR